MLPLSPRDVSRPKSESTESRSDYFGYSHLSNRSHSQTPVSNEPVDPHLLSPPISGKDYDLTPFKPASSDRTSLSMLGSLPRKKRRKRPEAKTRASYSDSKVQKGSSTEELGISRSMPDIGTMKDAQSASQIPDSKDAKHSFNRDGSESEEPVVVSDRSQVSSPERQHASATGSRRWTLASKTRTTRAFSNPFEAPIVSKTQASEPMQAKLKLAELPKSPGQPKSEVHNRLEESVLNDVLAPSRRTSDFLPDTPAMITLRRANSDQLTRRGSSDSILTVDIWKSRYPHSVPTDTVRQLLSKLLSARTVKLPRLYHGAKESKSLSQTGSPDTSSSDASCSATRKQSSITIFKTRDTATISSAIAEPAMTHVELIPAYTAQSDSAGQGMQRPTSTKVFAGSNIHEVVWERHEYSAHSSGSPSGNDNSRTSIASHEKPSTQASHRLSLATNVLDTMLKKSDTNTHEPPAMISQSANAQGTLVHGERVKKSRRKTLSSVFRSEWHADDRQNFEARNTDTAKLLEEDNSNAPPHQVDIAISTKPDTRQNRVFFFPPLPACAESQAWKSPPADINEFVSDVSSRRDDDHPTPYLMSTLPAANTPSHPDHVSHAMHERDESWLDPHDGKEGRNSMKEHSKSYSPYPTLLKRHTGKKLGSSSHNRRPSYEAQLSRNSRSSSGMSSDSQFPTRASMSNFVLDGSYSSNVTTRSLETDARGSEQARPTPEGWEVEARNSVVGHKLSVQDFVKRIERLTAESPGLSNSSSERDNSVTSWAEGVSFAGGTSAIPVRRHTLKSRVTDKLGDLAEESGSGSQREHLSHEDEDKENSIRKDQGASPAATPSTQQAASESSDGGGDGASVHWIGSQRDEW